MLKIELTGYLNSQQAIDALMLSPVKRKRILGQVSRKVRVNARKRLRSQTGLDGHAWATRKKKGPRMMRNMSNRLETYYDADQGIVTLSNPVIAMTAYAHQEGVDEWMSARVMQKKYGTPDYNKPCTKKQAKALRDLGFRQRRKGQKPKKLSLSEIQATMTAGQAGLIIRLMRKSPRKTSWIIPLPARSFLGATEQEINDMVGTVFNETIKAKA